MGTGRQAYSRLMDDKRVIYYHELYPLGPHANASATTTSSRSLCSLLLSLRRSSFVFFPTTHPSPFLPQPGGGSSNYPSSPPPPPPPLPRTPLSPRHSSLVPVVPRPASFIRRKIHLHNGPHAHRLLTRSIRIVYTPSWKLTSSTTTCTYVNNMYI